MHITRVRNWLLKFAVLGVYSFYVLASRGEGAEQDAVEALNIARKPVPHVVMPLPHDVFRIGKKVKLWLPRLPLCPPPHIS